MPAASSSYASQAQSTGCRRHAAACHPDVDLRRVRARRDPAGPAGRRAQRFRAAGARSARRHAAVGDRGLLAADVPDRGLHHAGGAHRRAGRHGVHDRLAGARGARTARRTDGLLLRDVPAVRIRRARRHRAAARLLGARDHPPHRRRVADRARHVVVGVGAAAADGQARAARRAPLGRRPGGAHGLLLQSRRHLHLPHDGGGVPRAGYRHAPAARPAAADAGGAAADVERARQASPAAASSCWPVRSHRSTVRRSPHWR